jgi:hypothetical protein
MRLFEWGVFNAGGPGKHNAQAANPATTMQIPVQAAPLPAKK